MVLAKASLFLSLLVSAASSKEGDGSCENVGGFDSSQLSSSPHRSLLQSTHMQAPPSAEQTKLSVAREEASSKTQRIAQDSRPLSPLSAAAPRNESQQEAIKLEGSSIAAEGFESGHHQASTAEKPDSSNFGKLLGEVLKTDSIEPKSELAETVKLAEGPTTPQDNFPMPGDVVKFQEDAKLAKAPAVEQAAVALPEAQTKAHFVGEAISIDFGSTSKDMHSLVRKARRNWDYDGTTVTIKDKEIIELTHIGVEEAGEEDDGVPGNESDIVRLFGWTPKSLGIANVWTNRFWTKQPGPNVSDAKLAYGIKVLNVPDIKKWEVDIMYLSPPPLALKVYPLSEVCERDSEGNLYVAFICDEEMECKDGKIQLKEIIFKPKGKDHMLSPDQVVNSTNDTALFAVPNNPIPQLYATNVDVKMMKDFSVDQQPKDYAKLWGQGIAFEPRSA